MTMETEFTSYAFQGFPRKKLKKYALQFHAVDMTQLLGADEDNFPFVARTPRVPERLKDSIDQGPETLYLLIRTKPNGKPDNQQNIFRMLRYHFDLTFREFKELATRIEQADSE